MTGASAPSETAEMQGMFQTGQWIHAMLFHMQLLKKMNDQISLQILCDLLESGGIGYRVEGAGMNSLLPLPGLIEARILVDEQDMDVAQALLADIESDEEGDHV
jgi:hypothetical protein